MHKKVIYAIGLKAWAFAGRSFAVAAIAIRQMPSPHEEPTEAKVSRHFMPGKHLPSARPMLRPTNTTIGVKTISGNTSEPGSKAKCSCGYMNRRSVGR
jgi:hypothetical protein